MVGGDNSGYRMGITFMLFDAVQNLRESTVGRRRFYAFSVLVLFAAMSVLGGCASNNQSDLAAYVKQIKSRKAGHIPPLPEFKSYESYSYNPEKLRDPFKPGTTEASIHAAGSSKGGPEPNLSRNKEPLEAFPLDSLKYVGVLQKGDTMWGIITAPDGFVYRVQVGNYMGQNYGRVLKITASQIDIRELVSNSAGGWTEQKAVLALTE